MSIGSAASRRERLLVINGLNLNVGGGRAVLGETMLELAERVPSGWSVITFIRQSTGLPDAPHIEYRVPKLMGNMWTARLWFERYGLRHALADRRVDVFLSLQGAGASVRADRHFVYCHNSLPLIPMRFADWFRYPRLRLSRLIYGLLYRYTIPASATLIVQQSWLRDAFARLYGSRRCIVAHPVRQDIGHCRSGLFSDRQARRDMIYPLSAHVYKNAELACRAVRLLEKEVPGQYRLSLTITGAENAYARQLYRAFGESPAIRFVGLLSRAELLDHYQTSALLLFPSRAESWGLPISEAKAAGMGVIAADLPYAHETVGRYDAAAFVDPDDAAGLARTIRGCWENPSSLRRVSFPEPAEPYAPNWRALIDKILGSAQDPISQKNPDPCE